MKLYTSWVLNYHGHYTYLNICNQSLIFLDCSFDIPVSCICNIQKIKVSSPLMKSYPIASNMTTGVEGLASLNMQNDVIDAHAVSFQKDTNFLLCHLPSASCSSKAPLMPGMSAGSIFVSDLGLPVVKDPINSACQWDASTYRVGLDDDTRVRTLWTQRPLAGSRMWRRVTI